ncbi:hypothetical protein A262_28342, partial [Pseudomonas syringae pv. actinidiae ICMP 19073]
TGLLIRQKTIYNYTVKTDCAHLEYYLHYPDFASSFFKGIAIAVILIFVFIAVLTGSVDRKRLMIITHRTDVTLGFEARFKHEVL